MLGRLLDADAGYAIDVQVSAIQGRVLPSFSYCFCV